MNKNNSFATKSNRIKKVLIIALVLSVMIGLILVPIFLGKDKVSLADAKFDYNMDKTVFELGDELTVPSATVTVGGKAYDAEYKIVFPSGREYSGQKVTLNECGAVKVIYFAKADDGKIYSKEVNLTVKQNLFSVEGTGSVEYVDAYKVQNLAALYGENKVEYEYLSGVKVSLASGAKLKYNKTIDLTKLTKNEPLITLSIIPEKEGEPDFRKLSVKVTDVNDPNRYLILRVKDKENDDPDASSYSIVGINSDLNNYRGTSLITSIYGEGCVFSFRGMPGLTGQEVYSEYTSRENDVISFYVDEVENIVYKSDQKPTLVSVCDLKGCNVGWEGFTNGLVNVEVFAENYKGANANIIVRGIENQDITSNDLVDEQAPEIFVEYDEGYGASSLPTGVVNKPYKIFGATGYDMISGSVEVKTFVYKNYYSSNRVMINVENGQFTPKTSGQYTIVYTAVDNSGNKVSLPLDITVLNTANPIVAEFYGNYETVAEQGKIISLASLNVTGGHGNTEYEVSVTNGTTPINIAKSVDGEGKTHYSFTALANGKYKVEYKIKDFITQEKTVSYDIDVTNSNGLNFVTDINAQLDKYFVKGFSYQLPNVKMYNFAGDGTYKIVDAVVSVENGNGSITDGIYVPAEEGVVTFKFSDGAKYKTVNRTVYNVNNGIFLDVSKMFIVENGAVENSGYIESSKNAYYLIKQDNTKLAFVNAVSAEMIAMMFNTEENKNEIGGIKFTATDKFNSTQSVQFEFNVINGNLGFSVNGGNMTTLSATLSGKNDIAFNFAASKGVVTVNNVPFNVLTYVSGDKFEGFDSNLAYLTVEFIKPSTNGFSFVAKEVAGLAISSRVKADDAEPIISILGDIGGCEEINSEFTIPSAIAYDAISPYIKSFTMSMKSPSGEYMVSLDGKTIRSVEVAQYAVKLTEYGTYRIEYRAEDYSGNVKVQNGTIKVLDLEPPTVTSTLKPRLGVTVGEEVNVQEISVSDNYCSEDKITVEIYVKDTLGRVSMVTDGKFVPTVAGEFVVYYYIYDEYDYEDGSVSQGNLTVVSYVCVAS